MATVPTTSEPDPLQAFRTRERGGSLCLKALFEPVSRMKRGENNQNEERKNDSGFEASEEDSKIFRTAFENYFFSNKRKYKKLKRIQKDFQQRKKSVVSCIIKIIKCFLTANLKPKNLEGWSKLRKKIQEFVDKDKPIEFLIIGFPCKSGNYQGLAFTFFPDMGELLALMHLCEFVEWIEKVYRPSACVSIACDTYAWKKLFRFDDERINLYRERLGKMIDFLNQGKFFSSKSKIIELCDHKTVDEALKKKESEAMKEVANAEWKSQELEADENEKEYRCVILKEAGKEYVWNFCGFEEDTRNEGKDSEKGQKGISVSQDSDELKNAAKSEEEKSKFMGQTANDMKDKRKYEKNLSMMVALFSKAMDFNSQEINKLFPEKIRLSVRKRLKVNERISFHLLLRIQNKSSQRTKEFHKSVVPWRRACIVQQAENSRWNVTIADLGEIRKATSSHLKKNAQSKRINKDQESLRKIKVLEDPCLGTPFLVTFTEDPKENNTRPNIKSLEDYRESYKILCKSRDS